MQVIDQQSGESNKCRPRFERGTTGYENRWIEYFYLFEAVGRQPNWEQSH